MQEADATLRKLGLAGLRGGSTPTAALVIQGALNEMRPGVYAFNDAQQVELGQPIGMLSHSPRRPRS
jgi:D-serine deaminase-like pyridoxal phosphate-dependent protein